MQNPLGFHKLNEQKDWDSLQLYLSPNKCLSSQQILKSLRLQGAVLCVMEQNYLDQDFSTSYSSFYSKIFRPHTKFCVRLHFFNKELLFTSEDKNPSETISELQASSDDGNYLGYIVKRPIPHAPISKSVIKPFSADPNSSPHLLVRSDFKVHINGAELTIRGFPFTQQDSRVGACAQAAIWSAGRHFHSKHRSKWYSITDITKAATDVAEMTGAMQLPAGASFLHLNEMVRAIRTMDRKPLIYGFGGNGPETPKPAFVATDPVSIISRYVDSGIPVILGLININGNMGVGHAITVSGHTLTTLADDHALVDYSSKAVFCKHFIAHDDQRGSNILVGCDGTVDAVDTHDYNIVDNIAYLIAPLPDKVFMSAEEAELIAWSVFERDYLALSTPNPDEVSKEIKQLLDLKEEVLGNRAANKVLARTYLTYGWKYKARAASNLISDTSKIKITNKTLPKFIWVTEFSYFDDQNISNLEDRKIFGHVVCDATSSVAMRPQVLSHFPGLLTEWPNSESGSVSQYVDLETKKYNPKIRGKI